MSWLGACPPSCLGKVDVNDSSNPPVVCFSSIDWSFLWQRHQILMSGLAARGHRVLFVENMGGRPPAIGDAWRLTQRARAISGQQWQGVRVERSVEILAPVVLPPMGTLASVLNDRLFLPRLASRIQRLGFRRPVVWTYSPTAAAMTLARLLDPSLLVYDCVANIAGYPHATDSLIRSEHAWIRSSDIVFTDAESLHVEKKRHNPNTFRVMPGVDADAFSPDAAGRQPEDLARVGRPRLCFFGCLGWWIDLEPLRSFAAEHPEWSVVIIGPVRTDVSTLAALPNVVFLGAKPHGELTRYLHSVDVICLPYAITEFTRGVIPAKIFEALAAGKPVVATPIPELRAFSGVIDLADRTEFTKAVICAREKNSRAAIAQRLAVARANSWEARIAFVAEKIQHATRLGGSSRRLSAEAQDAERRT
jgi:glycosyltransferase involved in cell wall biosynthesis